MSLELNLKFPTLNSVLVSFDDRETECLEFVSPLTAQNLDDIRWYLEVYSSQYMMDVDEERAAEIEACLDRWGEALFEAVFGARVTQRLFNEFQDLDERGRLVTISATRPEILGLPWELLRDPEGTFLMHENPRISVRRRLTGAGGGRRFYRPTPKDKLRMLFIISRPSDAGFINPRSDALAVMDAIAAEAAGQIEVEFLRPATLDALVKRLENDRLPRVDILHFDGHGVYDTDGRFWDEAKRSDRQMFTKGSREEAANTGYLLFEDETGKKALISAETLGNMLNHQRVGLIVLSACQSAAVKPSSEHNENETDESETQNDRDSPGVLGSVAARLTHGGIPAVLAMTHSVLVTTTRELFAQFYRGLARGQGMGEALDNARRHLYLHPERGTRVRGQQQEVTLRLQDWFLPALYQAGADTPLLLNAATKPDPTPEETAWGNLPEVQEAGFWGRSRELWLIERALTQKTRRLTIYGFGGEGKTYLAQEAGRWLHRTGLFDRVYFIDYSQYQGQDPVSYAVSVLSVALDRSLLDGQAVTAHLRTSKPVLLILDNLEALAAEPLRSLLDVAKVWSETGETRLLLTTRQPDFQHSDYPIEGSLRHQRLPLAGLGSEIDPNDALDYVQALMQLPPEPTTPKLERGPLIKLLALVKFHPLSIALVVRQLKERRIAEVGMRLAQLLTEMPVREGEGANPLVASLMLSLDRLDEAVRRWLPRLGVFEGGAFEDDLLAITGLGQTDKQSQASQLKQLLEQLKQGDFEGITAADTGLDAEQIQQFQQLIREQPEVLDMLLAQFGDADLTEGADESTWPTLRQSLETTGLIQAEYIPGLGVPFLKFHPTLAPVLWPQLSADEQTDLRTRHRQRYYQLSLHLYSEDDKNPLAIRAIARRELPNLMSAVRCAIAANDPDAVDFIDNVNRFLMIFGLGLDRQELTNQLEQLQGEAGSRTWYLARSNEGEALRGAGQVAEALAVFREVLAGLGDAPSYERCLTLGRIGRCLGAQGQAAQAAECYRAAIAVAEQLAPSAGVTRQRGLLYTDLGDVLRASGDFAGARSAYETSLAIKQEIGGDDRGEAVVNGQLGTLALVQGDLAEAETRYKVALETFQQLQEPASEATAWHQLGMVYEEAEEWEAADHHYRESARIKEAQGNLAGAAQTWNQLALVNAGAGRVEAAKSWYEKAIEGGKAAQDWLPVSRALNNLAELLQSQPDPSPTDLATARQHAEAALAIKQTLDPTAAIWTTYNILAKIAEKQGRESEARAYRQQARQAKANYAGTQHELTKHARLIIAVVMAIGGDTAAQEQLSEMLQTRAQNGWTNLVAAIRRILDGDRDETTLFDSLDPEDSMIIQTILQGIADPSNLPPQ